MKSYVVFRDVDESGVSGDGFVGWAQEFPNGVTVVTFRDDKGSAGVASAAVYQSFKDAERIHGHGGKTRFVGITPRAHGHHFDKWDHGREGAMMDDMENVNAGGLLGIVNGEGPEYTRDELFRAGYISSWRVPLGRDWIEALESAVARYEVD